MLQDLEFKVNQWRIRRDVFFRLYYHSRGFDIIELKEIWSSLAELDNVLSNLNELGVIKDLWQSHPPKDRNYNGRFNQDYLDKHLNK